LAEEAARKGPPLRLCGPRSSDAEASASHSVSSGAAGFYNPRRATETPFYRLVAGHFREFKSVYPEKYARDFWVWRGVIDDVVRKFLECGVLDHGFARVRCPQCRHEMFVAFSCKQRGFGPSCHQKKTLNLSCHLTQNVFAHVVPHRQFVFTIPKRFRLYFRRNRKLLGKLAQCAWRTVRDVYGFVLGEEAIPGAVVAIQTFGSLILWQPHIHAIISDGSFLPNGTFVPMPNLPTAPFLKVWEHHIFKMLIDEGRITPEVAENMRMWSHSGFSVHKDIRIEAGDTNGLEKLTQYIARCPFAQARMVKVTPEGKVLYRADHHNPIPFPQWRALPTERTLTRISASGAPGAGSSATGRNFEIFDPLDFLAQVTQHIPDKGQHLIRYYGRYSNKTRGCQARTDPAEGIASFSAPNSPPTPAKLRWAALIRKIYEVDPLLCPKCGAEMKIVAFIEDPPVIRKILGHLGFSSSGPDPPHASTQTPAVFTEPFLDDLPWGEHISQG